MSSEISLALHTKTLFPTMLHVQVYSRVRVFTLQEPGSTIYNISRSIGREDTARKDHVSALSHFSPEMTQTPFAYSPLVRTSHMICVTTRRLKHMGEQVECVLNAIILSRLTLCEEISGPPQWGAHCCNVR